VTNPPSTDDGWVLSAALRHAPRLLHQFDVDPGRVAARAGFDLRWLEDPDSRVAFTVAGRFLAECTRSTGCDHFALLLGSQEGFTALGIVGHLVQHSASVREALRTLSDFLHHQEVGGTTAVSEDRGIVVLEYVVHQQLADGGDEAADTGIGIAFAVLRNLCGAGWRPLEVQLMRAEPRDAAAYRRCLLAPVRFGADRNALLFDAAWLARPVQGANPDLHRILGAAVAELDAEAGPRFRDHVRTMVRTLLLSGTASCELVAERLGMNRRMLHRRLAAEDTTFERLLDETRYDLAQKLLRNSRAPLVEIASALNYGNPSAFTRAFQRWSGEAPSAWRRRQWIRGQFT